MTPKKANFRYDISFLRVVAVLSVVLYHFHFQYFEGGFIGVDIFFVISGYLMTSIIWGGISNNKFDLLDFYSKRINRIIPALLFAIITTGIMVYILLPIQFLSYLNSAFSSSLLFSNIYYYLQSGYFEASSHTNFLLHTWSLSVEWQFYIIFPLLVLLAKRLGIVSNFAFKTLLIVMTIASFAIMYAYTHTDKSFAFYITYTRIWEMLVGGLVLFYAKYTELLSKKLKLILSFICYFVLAYFIVNANPIYWPSYKTAFPVLATSIIIAMNFDGKLYHLSIFKYLGDISYSLYLYHWPISVFLVFFAYNESLQFKIFAVLFSILLAIASFELIEKRNYKNHTLKIVTAIFAIFLGFWGVKNINPLLFLGEDGNLAKSVTNYKTDEASKQYHFKKKNEQGTSKHITDYMEPKDFDVQQLKNLDNGKPNIILLGDSHAGMFGKTFDNIAKSADINVIQMTADGTYPSYPAKGKIEGSKEFFNTQFTQFFPKNHQKIDLVVISSNYSAYDKSTIDKNIKWSQQYFAKYKIKLLFLGQTNIYKIDYPTTYYVYKNYNIIYPQNTNSELKLKDKNASYQQIIGKDEYINLLNYPIQKISKDGEPYIYDNNHLSYYGTEQYKNIIATRIQEAIKK
ncbi:acyltransferase family protein [Chryseobacterium sp.]|uniref:acyltransferase family protein n=1 Tax=Chryseobacterium sp. TaxID=1871047 RepID=UPI00388F01F0